MSAASGHEFGEPASYPYMTVASPSCHDTSTTRAWYEEDAGRRERFWQQASLRYLGIIISDRRPSNRHPCSSWLQDEVHGKTLGSSWPTPE